MADQGMYGLARILLLIGGIVALIGGLLGLVGGFISAGPALAVIVGAIALAFYGKLSSEGVMAVLLILGLFVAALTGGIASIGGIMVSVAALIAIIGRYVKT